MKMTQMQDYLRPTTMIDWDHPDVLKKVKDIAGGLRDSMWMPEETGKE
jgi:hypothetical protein